MLRAASTKQARARARARHSTARHGHGTARAREHTGRHAGPRPPARRALRAFWGVPGGPGRSRRPGGVGRPAGAHTGREGGVYSVERAALGYRRISADMGGSGRIVYPDPLRRWVFAEYTPNTLGIHWRYSAVKLCKL